VTTTAHAVHTKMTAQAKEAFTKHAISQRSEGRWLLQRPHAKGWDHPKRRWDWMLAAEIICLGDGGSLYVGGDIDHVVFSYGPLDFLERVQWMGGHANVDHYVLQKASIGMSNIGVGAYDPKVAETELREMIDEYTCDDEPDDIAEGLVDFLRDNDLSEYNSCERLWEALCDGMRHTRFCEEYRAFGNILSWRVVYAHAALARLCHLLD